MAFYPSHQTALACSSPEAVGATKKKHWIQLANALESNTNVVSVSIGNAPVNNKGAKAFANVLKVNKVLTTLKLQDVGIRKRGIQAIARALEGRDTVLEHLDLSGNQFDDFFTFSSAGKAVARMLKVNTVLKTLVLNDMSSSVRYRDVRHIAEALEMQTTATALHTLNFSESRLDEYQNRIRDRSVYALTMATNDIADFTLNTPEAQTCNGRGLVTANGSCICYETGRWLTQGIQPVCDIPLFARWLPIIGFLSSLLFLCVFCGTCIDCDVRRTRRAWSRSHPITVHTLGGDTLTLADWGACKDLKVALHKIAPDTVGSPDTFDLFGHVGLTRVQEGDEAGTMHHYTRKPHPPFVEPENPSFWYVCCRTVRVTDPAHGRFCCCVDGERGQQNPITQIKINSASADATIPPQISIDTKYGSKDRSMMMSTKLEDPVCSWFQECCADGMHNDSFFATGEHEIPVLDFTMVYTSDAASAAPARSFSMPRRAVEHIATPPGKTSAFRGQRGVYLP